MKKPVHIFGHTNPDTDSICSAIAYGELKRELGEDDVEVFRLGDISKETKFVLEYFNMPTPKLLKGVKPTLSDLFYYEPLTVAEDCSLSAVWGTMKTSGSTRIAAITDENGKLKGVASVGDIARIFMDGIDESLICTIPYPNIIEVTGGTLIGGMLPETPMNGKFIWEWEIDKGASLSKSDTVIMPLHRLTQADYAAELAGKCGCLVIAGVTDSESLAKSLEIGETPVITTPMSIASVIKVIDRAISIGSVMQSKNIEFFTLENKIEDVIDATKSSSHRNFPVLDAEERLVGIFSRRHLIDYRRKKVILIDHNEMHQSAAGIENADIVEIIDHHRVANVQTRTPLFIRSEPVGSTATIIFKMYMENFLRPRKNIAGIMLSAVLSDTLLFNSPTCTKEDREAAYKLAKIAGVDIDEYGEMMFRESASYDEYSDADVLAVDRKEFSFGKYHVFISQINIIEFEKMSVRKEKLLAAMEDFKTKTPCDVAILMVTDIKSNGSLIIVTPEHSDLFSQAFGIPRGESSVYLSGVVSRKKQIVPMLMKAVQI